MNLKGWSFNPIRLLFFLKKEEMPEICMPKGKALLSTQGEGSNIQGTRPLLGETKSANTW